MDVIADAAVKFDAPRGYLNTATVGVPPRAAAARMHDAVDEWAGGAVTPTDVDHLVRRGRAAFARIVGAPASWTAVTTTASVATAHAAALLSDGDRVVVAQEDFTSVLFPLLQAAGRAVDVMCVPLDRLLDAVEPGVAMVAVSAAQSADGRVLDLDELSRRAAEAGALTFVDATQAAGWLPIGAGRFSITTSHAYKWLCSPRGVAFMTVADDLWERLEPVAPGWYAGEDPWASIYGPPLRLASDARRYDLSPSWLGWAAAAPTLELLADLGPRSIGAHDLRLANRLRAGLGMEPSDSAIVSADVDASAASRLDDAGVRVSLRAGRLRASCHLYTTDDDVDAALDVLA